MRVRVTTVFRDKFTHEIYEIGAVREFSNERARHLISLGLVVAVEEPKPAKAEVKVEEPKTAEPEPAKVEEKVEETETEQVVENDEPEIEFKPKAVVPERQGSRKKAKK